MDDRIKTYDEKMTKTYNNLLSEFGQSAQDAPIRTY